MEKSSNEEFKQLSRAYILKKKTMFWVKKNSCFKFWSMLKSPKNRAIFVIDLLDKLMQLEK